VGAEFKILGSSSSGNSALLRTPDFTILIDAGFSGKRLGTLLGELGMKPTDLDAVFLTHEHSDHASGVRGLSRFGDLPFFANRDTANAIQSNLKRRANWRLFETGLNFEFRGLKVSPFSIPHDAYDPVGFLFEWGGHDLFSPFESLAWVTDLGSGTNLVREKIRGAKTLVIETNYDEEMLEHDTRRPWALKQRIKGRHGHLSNNDAFKFLEAIESPAWRKVVFAHLSKDCNAVSRVAETFSTFPCKDCELSVVDPRSGELVSISPASGTGTYG
jgi:phosphoribosyl 1,2-cyclic phosphodiesterase